MPKKGKKGKGKGDQQQQKQQKSKGPKVPKVTPAATKERRAKTHQNRVAKKERHLMKRCEALEKKVDNVHRHEGMSLGKYHRNLMHMFQLRTGTRKMKPRKQQEG